MSLAKTGLAFRHQRTSTIRNVNADQTDAGGQESPPDWEPHLTNLPCRAWTNAAVEPADAAKQFVMEDRRVMVALGTDVTEQDQLGDVTDRAGNVLFAGPMNILGVLAYTDHLELSVKDIR